MCVTLPKDPQMLLSVINTKLRNDYASLEALCDDLNTDINQIIKSIEQIDYVYDKAVNQFRPKSKKKA